MYVHMQPNGINTLLPSAPNGMGGEMPQPLKTASDDGNLHPVGKKMSAPGILQPYNQVGTSLLFHSTLPILTDLCIWNVGVLYYHVVYGV